MKTQMLLGWIKLGIAASAVMLSLQARADSPDHRGPQRATPLQIATGQFVTPTAPRGAVQQFLNPGLAAYPNFVAGEAVRSQLSPDGTTLAILCAGQNSLDKPDGTARRRQLDAVHLPLRRERRARAGAGAHAGDPADERPRRPRLLARRQHALRRGRQRRRRLRLHQERRHLVARPNDRARPRAARGSASASAPTPAASASPPTARRWSSPTTTTTRSASIDTATRHGPLRARPAPVLRGKRGRRRRRRRHLPVRASS